MFGRYAGLVESPYLQVGERDRVVVQDVRAIVDQRGDVLAVGIGQRVNPMVALGDKVRRGEQGVGRRAEDIVLERVDQHDYGRMHRPIRLHNAEMVGVADGLGRVIAESRRAGERNNHLAVGGCRLARADDGGPVIIRKQAPVVVQPLKKFVAVHQQHLADRRIVDHVLGDTRDGRPFLWCGVEHQQRHLLEVLPAFHQLAHDHQPAHAVSHEHHRRVVPDARVFEVILQLARRVPDIEGPILEHVGLEAEGIDVHLLAHIRRVLQQLEEGHAVGMGPGADRVPEDAVNKNHGHLRMRRCLINPMRGRGIYRCRRRSLRDIRLVVLIVTARTARQQNDKTDDPPGGCQRPQHAATASGNRPTPQDVH